MHEKFRYNSLEEIKAKVQELDVSLPLSENTHMLAEMLKIGDFTVPNRIAIQPMEGCDGEVSGAPGELTIRRYQRFAAGGAGLIWVEATAIVPEARANPRQIMLTPDTLDSFKALAEEIREIAQKENGITPMLILQLTHSGRYSAPNGVRESIIAFHNKIFEKDNPLGDDRIITDDALSRLPERYALASKLAGEAGFDGVDIKACHGYLLNELLAAHTRSGKYGGSFENRTRLMIESIEAARAATDILVTSRMSLHDGFPYPYGWGADESGAVDLADPIKLVEILHEKMKMPFLNFTVGNPYVNPHVNRPFDEGFYTPPEHPFEGLGRVCDVTAKIRERFPKLQIMASAFSYPRQYSINMAAGMLEQSHADLVGFGRMAFAYPDFARDMLEKGKLDPRRCCVSCGKCSELMRAVCTSGCVLKDSDTYLPIYMQGVKK